MKKNEVRVGESYVVKVSGQLVPVRIESECPHGGWYGKNEITNRQVRIRTAARLRRVVA